MGIYLPNMEMPTNEYGSMTITIYPNGSVAEYIGDIGRILGPAVPVPPHGALIDRDDFFAQCPELVNGYKAITDDLVVIPAEEKGENFCADCHWYEAEQQYCFRNGCHAYNESTCEHWDPVPADEPIPAEEET